MQTAKIIPFHFEAHQVRTILVDDQPWFVAADVASALQYRIAGDMTRNLDEDEKGTQIVRTPGGDQEMLVINESGLYSAILRSRKAEAKRFKKWVTAEVLPAIRKHGRYEDSEGKMSTLIGQTIGTDGFHMLGAVVKGKVSSLPAAMQRRATSKIWSQTHAAFGVRSAADIPADQLDSARNFIAAYALEGEWLGKEPKHQPNLSYPIATLVARRAGMLTVRNDKQAWLDVTLHDLRDIRGDETPCEKLLGELHKAGYDIEGCWWELRTYRNKVRELASFATGMNRVIEDPHRYAVASNGKSI
ncbi:BRO family protein [Pseudomonas gregormendelii]|uniref:BRO family protein n=1 Tax=Pseudomonas gregormendelii TaxID=1628277 RepID=UPI001980DA0E